MTGFVPPPYPYDRLAELEAVAVSHEGGVVDCSVGTPMDPPPDVVVAALEEAIHADGPARAYPPSIGTERLREAAAAWLARRMAVDTSEIEVAACVGTKELVVGLPHWLGLRDPGRDTVLYPAVSYPSYAMGATLAGCRAVAVPVDEDWRLRLDAIDPTDAARARCLWVNTPGNPAGGLDDLEAVAEWGRRHGVVVLSDECYVEFTWVGEPRTVLHAGPEGVVAVHSLSKRSNLAGLRAGFYAGDPELVTYLREVRKHAGFMVPGPVQAAAAAALDDDPHVEVQRRRYERRLTAGCELMAAMGIEAQRPDGGFYLWVTDPGGDGWALARRLATEAGVLASPGEFYGDAGRAQCRLAMVQPDERFALAAERIGGAGPPSSAR